MEGKGPASGGGSMWQGVCVVHSPHPAWQLPRLPTPPCQPAALSRRRCRASGGRGSHLECCPGPWQTG